MTMDTLQAFISSFVCVCVWGGGGGGGGCSPTGLILSIYLNLNTIQ